MATFNRPGDQMGLKPAGAYNNQGVASGGPSSSPYSWQNFFGASRGNSPTNPYDPQRKPTWILPESYSGSNEFLRKVIDMKVFLADNFYTTDLAPMQYTDRLDVQWNRWEFSPKFAGLVPERGVTRLVESRRSGGRATFERRGLGFLLTHGFMHTAEGRAHYQMNLRQIYESVVETNNFGVIYAYLTADKPALNWSAHHGTALGRNLQEILQNEVELWDIFKRVEHGGDILDVVVADVMSKFQGEADTWIVAKKVGLWYTAIPEDKQKYWAGDRQRSINNIVDGTGAFRFFNSSTGSGARVFLVRQYHVDNQYQAGLDILKAPYQIGEHHIMADPNRNGDYSGYTSKWRSVMIFDEDSDTFKEITLLMALDNCHRFDARSGDLIKIDDSSYLPYNPSFSAPDQRDFLHYYDSGKPETCKLMGNIEHDANDLFDLIRTARPQIMPKNSVLEGSDHKVMDPETIYRKGLNALNIIEGYELDANNVASFRAYFDAVITLNNGRYPPVANPRSTSQTVEYNSNPATGTLDIPTIDGGVFALPPCFGSFPGFKAIAEMSRQGQAATKGYDVQLCKDVEEFVAFFDKFADNLSKVFVDCVFLKPRYASSWWRRPTPATVLFENLVGTYRNPVFLDVTDDNLAIIGRQAKNPVAGSARAQNVAANDSIDSDLLTPVASYRNTAQKVVEDLRKGGAAVTDTLAKVVAAATNARIVSDALSDRIDEAKVRGILTFLVSQIRADAVQTDNDTFATFAQKLEAAINPHIRFGAQDVPTIVTSVAETIAALSKFVRSNKDAFRRSSNVDKQMNDIIAGIEIQGDIDPSSKDAEASNVELFGNQKAQALRNNIDMNTNSRRWRRAPLIMTPGIFKNLIDFADAQLPVLPADPENPNNPISVSSLARLTRLMQADDQDMVADLPASLKPNYINSQRVGSRLTNTSFSDVAKLSAYQSINYNMNASGESTESATFKPSQTSSALIGASMPGAGIRSSSRRPGRISHIADAEAEEELELTAARNDVEANSRRIFASGVSDSTDKHIMNAMTQSTMRAQFLGLEDNIPSDLDRIIGQVFLGTTTNKKAWVSLIRNNVLFPTDFLLSRPHARYQTYTAIKVKAGAETAVTYMGNSHFTLGDNVATQTHLGAFTYYSATVVFEPRNVFVVRNSFVEGYDGGMGTKFYEIGKYNPSMQKYGDEPLTNTKGGSLFAMMIPRGGFDLPSPMSITGRFTMFDRQIFSMNEEKVHYPTAFFYNKLWGFSDQSLGTLDINSMRYINERTAPNGVTHEGHTLYYSPSVRDFKRVRLSRGHWGSEVTYSGCGQVRRGAMKRFRIQDWSRDYAMV